MKNKNHFLVQVTSQIKSKEAKVFITDELNYHIQETKKSLIQNGIREVEAEQKAIEQMGSPIQLGMQFNKLHRPRVDWLIVILFVSALSIGFLPILFSYGYADTDYYLRQKIMIVLIGIATTLIVMFVDYRKMKNKGWLFYSIGILLLLINIFLPNTYVNGVPNITVGPLTIENLMVVPFFLIAWGSFLNNAWLKPSHFIVLFFIPTLLFLNIPSISTTYIYIVMVFCMIWWSNFNRKSIIKIFSACALISSSIGFWLFKPEQIQRLKAFLDPERYSQGEAYLTFRLKELMSNANMFGNPAIKEFVPQGQTNFVYVFITYYYGWFFAIVLGILLSLFIVRIILVVPRIQDTFGKLLLVGAIALYSVQMITNIAMTLGFFPLIEMSLPFISYGLMPVLLNSFLMGIVLSVYRRKDITSHRIVI